MSLMSEERKVEISAGGTHSTLERAVTSLSRSRPMTVSALGFVLIIFAIGFPLSRDANPSLIFLIVVLGAALVCVGVAIELMTYLQSAKQSIGSSNAYFNSIIQKSTETNLNELRQIRSEVERLKNQKNDLIITKAEKNEIVTKINESITSDITDRIAYSWENKFKKQSEQATYITAIGSIYSDTKNRLEQEVATLGKRANLNLTFGVIISAAGISILAYFIYITTSELNSGMSTTDVFIRFLIRFSLAAFIQIFAYFFLRLYRYSIFETKYFQNEITNIDEKSLALQIALYAGEKNLISHIAKELSKTERNFIIKKGDTTVGLRREEMEIDFETSVISRLERLAAIKEGKSSTKGKTGDD